MKNALIILLVIAGLLLVTCVGGVIFGMWWIGRNVGPPEGIAVTIDRPDRVKAGSEFNVVITIENLLDRERTLMNIDFYDPLLSGVTVKNVSTPYHNVDPTFGSVTYAFGEPIAPRSTMKITFVMSADTPGVYTGDLDVAIDSVFRFTSNTQTFIIDPKH